MEYARIASLALLMVTVQIVIIITFASGWLHFSRESWFPPKGPFLALVPFHEGAYWPLFTTSIVMYITSAIGFLYIMWTVVQSAFPDRITFDFKKILLIDMIFSGVFTINLIIAFGSFAAIFIKADGLKDYYVGYCFWLAVVGSITSGASTFISGREWFRD